MTLVVALQWDITPPFHLLQPTFDIVLTLYCNRLLLGGITLGKGGYSDLHHFPCRDFGRKKEKKKNSALTRI